MLKTVNIWVAKVTEAGLWIGFLALMVTVGLQVAARNLFSLPLVWTLDLAQLLFSWLVFIGAAIAFRRGTHYTVDLWPGNWHRLDAALRIVGFAGAGIVIFILIRYGSNLVAIRRTGTVQSLDISRAWMFVPIPLGGTLMLMFLIEMIRDSLRPRPA